MKRMVILCICCCLCLTFCGQKTDIPKEKLLTSEADLKIVKNADKPEHGQWDFAMEEEWAVDQAGEYTLVRVSSVREAENGDIYFLDRKYKKVITLNAAGEFLRAFGKVGEGPGEFKDPAPIYLNGDHLIIHDVGRKVHYFTREGKYLNSYKTDKRRIPEGFVDDYRYVTVVSNLDEKNETVEAFDLKSGKAEVIGGIIADEFIDAAQGGVQIRIKSPMFNPTTVLGVKGKTIYFGKSDKYFIKKIDFTGKGLLGFTIEGRARNPITSEFKKKMAANYASGGSQGVPKEFQTAIMKSIPDECTYFNRFYVDETGLLYIYLTELGNKKEQAFDIFSPGGRYLYRGTLALAEGLSRVGSFVFGAGHVYVVVENKEGDRKLAKYRIKKPTAK